MDLTMAAPTQLDTSCCNDSEFIGFSQDDIFDGDICKIIPKTISTTVYIKPCAYDNINNELKARYGQPENKGKHGHIFRGSILEDSILAFVTITSYSSTCTLSIQGRGHSTWVYNVLKDIVKRISSKPEDSTVDFSLDFEVDFPPLSQSTPQQSQSIPRQRQVSSSQDRLKFCDGSTQTDTEICCESNKQIQDLHAQLELYKEMNSNLQTQLNLLSNSGRSPSTDANKNTSPKDSKCAKPSSKDSKCAKQSSASISVPTSNQFQALDIEDCPEEPVTPLVPTAPPEEPITPLVPTAPPLELDNLTATDTGDLPTNPLPKPKPTKNIPHKVTPPTQDSTAAQPLWLSALAHKPSPQTEDHPTDEPTAQDSQSEKQHVPSHSRKKVLILGDSITKGLVGRRMSRRHLVINRSISGTTINQWIRLAPIFVEEERPDIVILHCGTNNVTRNYTHEGVSLIDKLLTGIKSINPDVSIFVSSLTFQVSKNRNAWINEFNHRVMDLCKTRNCMYISNDNTTTNYLSCLSGDGLHLNRAGITLLAKNFISVIKECDQFFQTAKSKQTVR